MQGEKKETHWLVEICYTIDVNKGVNIDKRRPCQDVLNKQLTLITFLEVNWMDFFVVDVVDVVICSTLLYYAKVWKALFCAPFL